MCGLFGFADYGGSWDRFQKNRAISILAGESEERGRDAAGIAYVKLGGVRPNPRLSLVREGIEICRREGIDFLLAVGGGSVIDSCKAISSGCFYEGRLGAKASPDGAWRL